MTERRGGLPNQMVHPVHFEDFDGHQFERLCFAYLFRTDNWITLEWYGQVGSDSGRDIWGVRERDEHPQRQKVLIQCANRKALRYEKVKKDLGEAIHGPNGKPDALLVVAGGMVSAKLRDRARTLCEQNKVLMDGIWSGGEFEERLRAKAESLLRRFVTGEVFPDSPPDLRQLGISAGGPITDSEILALMAALFDRPAFHTPFREESSIPAFKKAITDTIEALNTGIHRLRDGTEIRRIPSRHEFRSAILRQELAQIEGMLCKLRAEYDGFIKSKDIRPCGCDVPDCSVFFASRRAAYEMDRVRGDILAAFRRIYPAFNSRLPGGLHLPDRM